MWRDDALQECPVTEDRLKAIRIDAGGLSAGVVRFGATLTELALQGPEGPVNVVTGHWLRIAADASTPVDTDKTPTGEIHAISASRFGFRKLRPIRSESESYEGYDHNFALAERPRRARLRGASPASPLGYRHGCVDDGARPEILRRWQIAGVRGAVARALSAGHRVPLSGRLKPGFRSFP